MSGELLGYSDNGPWPAEKCSLNNLLLNWNNGKLFGERAPEPYMSEVNKIYSTLNSSSAYLS